MRGQITEYNTIVKIKGLKVQLERLVLAWEREGKIITFYVLAADYKRRRDGEMVDLDHLLGIIERDNYDKLLTLAIVSSIEYDDYLRDMAAEGSAFIHSKGVM